MGELTYAGRSFLLRIDNGVMFRNTYSADGTTLHYETLEGPTTGARERVTLHTAQVGSGQFLMGWVEESGMTVTHVIDLGAATVHAFWTYENNGTRLGELHTGTLVPD